MYNQALETTAEQDHNSEKKLEVHLWMSEAFFL